ncbi:MAG: dihydropteroate synthase, partial [Eubacteriales bacterium]|nr:dihydropteroate synthase [Eubacteriales bacterium]
RVELVGDIVQKGCGVVALPIGTRMPADADARFSNAVQLAQLLVEAGVKPADIYLDALVSALATDDSAGVQALDTIARIRAALPGVHVTCGLSNLSFGLPRRKLINAAFLQFAVERGLDSVILDVANADLRLSIAAAEAVLGRDEYCMRYVTAAK